MRWQARATEAALSCVGGQQALNVLAVGLCEGLDREVRRVVPVDVEALPRRSARRSGGVVRGKHVKRGGARSPLLLTGCNSTSLMK